MDVGDLLVTVGLVGLIVSLIPGIERNFRFKTGWTFVSCVLSAAYLAPIVVGLVLLDAPVAAALDAVIIVMWAILAAQSWWWGT